METLEEMFEDNDNKFKKEHPFLTFIDGLFKDESLVGYRASYIILHPWIFIEEGWIELKHAYQRVFRGYDDRVIWSIDYYLSDMIPIWMERLIEDKHGTPMMMFSDEDMVNDNSHHYGEIKNEVLEIRKKEYDAILQKIADGFRGYQKMDEVKYQSEEYNKLQGDFDEAFDLFKKYWGTYWD